MNRKLLMTLALIGAFAGVGAALAQTVDGLDLDAIRASVGEKLAKFKQPKVLEVVKELPRNTMGKVQKNMLRDQFAEAFKTPA